MVPFWFSVIWIPDGRAKWNYRLAEEEEEVHQHQGRIQNERDREGRKRRGQLGRVRSGKLLFPPPGSRWRSLQWNGCQAQEEEEEEEEREGKGGYRALSLLSSRRWTKFTSDFQCLESCEGGASFRRGAGLTTYQPSSTLHHHLQLPSPHTTTLN